MNLWDAFWRLVENNLGGVLAGIVAISAFLFGSGAYWQYRKHKISVEVQNMQVVVAASEVQTRMLEIHQNILSKIQPYIGLRDDYIRSRGNKSDRDDIRGNYDGGVYEIQNLYNSAVSELAHLINTYNDSEARLSILEERQPRWFNMRGLVPPGPATNFQATPITKPDGTRDVRLSWSLPDKANQLHTEVMEHLKLLFRDYGQDFPDDEVEQRQAIDS